MYLPESILKKLRVITSLMGSNGKPYRFNGVDLGKIPPEFFPVMNGFLDIIKYEENEIRFIVRDIIDAYEELHIFHTINESLGPLLDENEVARMVLEKAVSIVKARKASVMFLDETGEKMRIAFAKGIQKELLKQVEVKIGDPYAGWVLETRKPLLVEDIEKLPEDMKLPRRGKYSSKSFLIVPILAKNLQGEETPLGVINLADKEDGVFTAGDLKLVTALARAAGAFILNTRLIKEMRSNEKLKHELEIAANIQRSLLPPERFENEKVSIVGVCIPASYVGGDYFDYMVNNEKIRMVIGDISGHGLGSALYMSSFRSFFRALRDKEIDQVMPLLNRLLSKDLNGVEIFVTASIVDVESDGLRVSIAGHPPPLIFSMDGKMESFDISGMPLGIFPDIVEFQVQESNISSGDLIFMYTDGLVDARNPQNRPFGLSKIARIISSNIQKDVSEIAEALKSAVLNYTENQHQDDMTFLLVRIK